MTRICLIGLGEVGTILAEDIKGAQITAWDLKFPDANSLPSQSRQRLGLKSSTSAQQAVTNADLIISAVTAAETVNAAKSVTAGLKAGAIYFDLNSASPSAKRAAAEAIEAKGGRYVEAAIMTPIGPKRVASAMNLGGPHAQEFLAQAQKLGFAGAKFYDAEVGRASAAKMCRSVIIKGLESLLSESLLAARRYGVDADVLASLDDLLPGQNWEELSRYMISRSLQHGTRRAEEMREVAKTVKDAGIDPWMSTATAERQDWAAGRKALAAVPKLPDMLDGILGAGNGARK